ncbi:MULTISPECIES: ABCB family ABC transporter ATP-binding protein/permease [unclassified Colwellia]|uniref:ABCB family ABC transporter ATP-binding protein/permease n=1 Tax=unclassified Colwellia TaxID=196834 RepID=UPI0015F5021F|nr:MULTISPECIES: ABC transporter ATP-binding protein/permease [unclassified Colwellia]MBA6233919.1 ABC transporter ATP-binding protein/permease [Colwellia sp. MB02u-7]MBA6237607.1 ABC transporter ATP-binding protein/permease [Colwellia sp. MB02u-11]MBA6256058.1 ABC transporter ATP-binding protein/permease [Colwellia sp. MB3u-28]MBA6260791.1 ABC transporter ATP-binding protein/permease [Colwellia sp. MB3u-41]MBA6300592.1 ABC transporter ATP-binding protein/permease [Colwellia sp. MB3u-22]
MRRSSYPSPENATINWRVLKSLIPYLLEFKVRIGFALFCLVLTKLASVYLPFILKDIVDGLDAQQENNIFIVPFALVAAYGLVRLTIVLLAEIRDTLFGRVTERAIRRIGLKVFEHLHQLDLDFHLNRQTGGLSRDIDRGTSGVNFLMRFMVFNIVPTLLEIVMVITILWVNYGIWFALITGLSITCYIAYSIYATEWRTRYIRAANKADSSSNTRAIDSLLNYETVKYFTNESYESNAYDSQLADWEKAKMQNRLSLFALNGGQAIIVSLAMTAMLALAAYQVTHQQMTLGDFVLVNAFMMQLFIPLNFLGFVYREIKGSLANIEQMFTLLQKVPKVVDSKNAKELTLIDGAIIFDNVSFFYDKTRPILKNVSFEVKAGQKVAVVGESGSGKSTLVKLLFRFYDCQQGQIKIDGEAVIDITQHSLRKNIGIVPQDTVLFNESLFENVKYGNVNASHAEVEEAARLSHLSEFISSLPSGFDSVVGERGLKLSGGEKQRVAIARTILKNPAILVFDEATSSLDSHSEQAILKAIKDVAKDHTSLVIAHRLSTIVDADNIIVLHKGEIIEQGDHQTLLSKQGHYANMWQLQQNNA